MHILLVQVARFWIPIFLALTVLACQPISTAETGLVASTGSPAPAASATAWPSYTFGDWGVSFHYPPDWQVEATSASLRLSPPRSDGAPTGGGVVTLEPYAISPGYDLRDWVQWRSRESEHPVVDDMIITFPITAQMPFAPVGDQVVYAIQDSPLLHRETVWVAQDGLVFRIGGFAAPEYRYHLAQIAASLTFDRAVLASLAADGLTGDETALQAAVQRNFTPQAAVAQAAVRNRQAAPAAQPTSPLERYTGHSPYGADYPDFTVQYDPTIWTLAAAGAQGSGDWLQNRQVEDCALALNGGPTETSDSRWRWIGEQWWVEARLNAKILLYSFLYDGAGYIFGLAVPELDPTNARQPCQRLAEQVLSTFALVTD